MKRYLHIFAIALMFGAFNVTAQQLYWDEDGTNVDASFANDIITSITKASDLSTNVDTWIDNVGSSQHLTIHPALSFEGYPGSGAGNSLRTAAVNRANNFPNSNSEYLRRFTTGASPSTIYLSAMLKVVQVKKEGAAFPFGLVEIIGSGTGLTKTWGSRLLVDKTGGSNANGTFQLGVTKNTPADGSFKPVDYNTGEVLIIVMKLTMNSGTGTDDVIELQVYTASDGMPISEPTSWDVSTSAAADVSGINGVFIREKFDGTNTTDDPFVDFGHLRVADSWSALLPIVEATDITVSSAEGTTIPNFTSTQLSSDILPTDASFESVTWSVVNQTGIATVTTDGNLVAFKEGTVNAIATAKDGSGVTGELQIVIEPNTEDGLVYRAEAEFGEVLSGAVITGLTCANKSGEGLVKYSDSQTAKSVHAYVDAPYTGDFTLRAYYFNANASKLSISTDDSNYSEIDFAAAIGCADGAATAQDITISLIQGTNTIYFQNTDLASTVEPLLDYLEVIDPNIYVETINVTSIGGMYEVDAAATLQMQVEILPANATLQTVTWSVDDVNIATIDANGLLTGVAEGLVNVKATSNDLNAIFGTREVVVGTPIILVSSITVTSEVETNLAIGQTSQMSAVVLPASADDLSVTWSVTNGTGQATIDPSTGVLTGVSAGTITAVATANDVSLTIGSLALNIINIPVTDINVTSAAGQNIDLAETSQMSAEILPALATDKTIIWSVEGSAANIDVSGLLTADSEGVVTVVATANDGSGVTGTYDVIVGQPNVPVEVIDVSSATGNNIPIGNAVQLTAEALPTYATEQLVTWSVTNGTGEATINQSGYINGLTLGTVTAIATANDGSGIMGELAINVTNGLVFSAEAEDGVLTSGAVVAGSGCSNASGTGFAKYSDSQTAASSHSGLTITDTRDYIMTLHYFRGVTEFPGSLEFSIDDATFSSSTVLEGFEPVGFCVDVPAATIDFTINLTEGTHTLYLRNTGLVDNTEPLIDVIEIFEVPAIKVSSISVTSQDGTDAIAVNGTLQMLAEVLPANASVASYTWSVDNEAIGTIDANGLLTGIADGYVEVIATANDGSGVTGTLEIVVGDPITLVAEINVTSASGNEVNMEQTLQLSAEVLPDIASDPSITWSVTNGTGEATIDQNGLLLAISEGTVTAVATANDGSTISGTLEITIVDPTVLVTTINVSSEAGISIEQGQTSQMSGEVLPIDATDASVTWSVQNGTGDASIDQNGLLTAVSAGSVTVMATANDASGTVGELGVEVTEPEVILGVNENILFTRIYPNPVINSFYIESGELDLKSIKLLDLNGSVVIEKLESDRLINISDLPSAIYVIKAISSTGEQYISRIIKK